MYLNSAHYIKPPKKHRIFYKMNSFNSERFETEHLNISENRDRDSNISEIFDQSYVYDETRKVLPGTEKRYDAEIFEYCPKIFREIRTLDSVTPEALAE